MVHEWSTVSKVFGISSCFLHSLIVAVSEEHLVSWVSQVHFPPLFKFSPDDYQLMGFMAGLLVSPLLYHYVGLKTSLHFTRIALALASLPIFHLTDFHNKRPQIFSILYFSFQGFFDSSSRLLISLYVSGFRPSATHLVLSVLLPRHMSKFTVLAIQKSSSLAFELGYFAVLAVSTLLLLCGPRIVTCETNSNEMEDGCRPVLVVTGTTLLSTMTGRELYSLYTSWSTKGILKWESDYVLAGLSTAACCIAMVATTRKRQVWMSATATGFVAISLLSTGWVIYLENTYFEWLPGLFYLTFIIADNIGLNSLYIVITVYVIQRSPVRPPTRRLVFALILVLFLRSSVSRLNKSAIGALIRLFQPFGLFWLHSSIQLFGFFYLVLVLKTELFSGRSSDTNHVQLVEFVTQV